MRLSSVCGLHGDEAKQLCWGHLANQAAATAGLGILNVTKLIFYMPVTEISVEVIDNI
jgi:hypothetical protein